MKKVFLALALAGFIGAASANTVAAITSAPIAVNCGGDEKDKKKKSCCSKDKKACTATATTESKEGKTCAKSSKCCKAKTADASKTETAPAGTK